MDASAYLRRQGWLGNGHALHPSGKGIKKPLAVSKKSDVFGVGKKKVDVHADQWWARAFDHGLKTLDIGKSQDVKTVFPPDTQHLGDIELLRKGGAKWTGLFDGFVKGESLQATFSSQTAEHGVVVSAIQQTAGSERNGGTTKTLYFNGYLPPVSHPLETKESTARHKYQIEKKKKRERTSTNVKTAPTPRKAMLEGVEAKRQVGTGITVQLPEDMSNKFQEATIIKKRKRPGSNTLRGAWARSTA